MRAAPAPFLPFLIILIAGGIVYLLWLHHEQKEAARRQDFMDAIRAQEAARPAATHHFTCWLCRTVVVQPVEQLKLEDSLLCTACTRSLHHRATGAA